MAKHEWTVEEEQQVYQGYFIEKKSLQQISHDSGVGLKPLRRYIKENNWHRDDINKLRGNGQNRFKDETGKVYGDLLVLKVLDEKDSDNRNLFLCQCKCGNLTKVSGKRLRLGTTSSCGCKRKQIALETLKKYTPTGDKIGVNLIGQKFGQLTVLQEVEPIIKANGKPVRQWLCQCDCGNKIIVQHVYLTTGDTQSCGCIISQGEAQIEQLLKTNNIKFAKQYSFSNLRGTLPYRFDFAIFDNDYNLSYLIEYDGAQHYDINNGLFSLNRAKVDMIKNQYCLDHKIPLIRIPYTCKNQIT